MDRNHLSNSGRFSSIRNWPPAPANMALLLLVILVVLGAQAVIAAPQQQTLPATTTLPFQGRLDDAQGNPVNGNLSITFRLYSAASGGSALWTESRSGGTAVSIAEGLFSVMLGSITPIPASVVTANPALWLSLQVGADAEMSPRIQLGTVPYAVQALTLAGGNSGIPTGAIIMWSGSIASIPAGWQLADGTNGTPDLRDRFILGTGAGQDPGETGGAHLKTLSVAQLPAHTHAFTTDMGGAHSHGTRIVNEDGFEDGSSQGGVDNESNQRGLETTSDGNHQHSGTTNATGSGSAIDIRPAYYRLAFIVKM